MTEEKKGIATVAIKRGHKTIVLKSFEEMTKEQAQEWSTEVNRVLFHAGSIEVQDLKEPRWAHETMDW